MIFLYLLNTILVFFQIYLVTSSSINELACKVGESIFIKSSHEINHGNANAIQQFQDQTEEDCFTKCHLNHECKSTLFKESGKSCFLYNVTLADVNSKIKPSNETSTFHKQKCKALSKFISLVDKVVDCKDIYDQGWHLSGIYGVPVIGSSNEYEPILCEMSLRGGGWTVIQQRVDGSVDFNRYWQDYKNGFGQLDGNFWYGNDRIHKLTWSTSNEVIMPSYDTIGKYYAPRYSEFKVASELSKYKLTVGNYLGGFENSSKDPTHNSNIQHLSFHNGLSFTSRDVDNDLCSSDNCAVKYKGGWWFKACYAVYLNGIYGIKGTQGITWLKVLGEQNPLTKVKMMVRKK